MSVLLSVITIGFSSYKDVWPYYSYFFKKHWGNCSLKHIFVSDFEEGPNSFFSVCSLDSSACSRFYKALENINTDYVLVLLEDYCISSPVSECKFFDAVSMMEKYDIEYLQLFSFINKLKGNKIVCKKPILIKELLNDLNYKINLQPSIWKTSFLKKVLETKPNTLWDFENNLKNDKFLRSIESKTCYLPKPFFRVCNFIDKGKVTPDAIKLIKKENLQFPTREVMKKNVFIKIKLKRKIIDLIPNKLLIWYLRRKR